MKKPEKKLEFVPSKPRSECIDVAEEKYEVGYIAGYNQACDDWEAYHEWYIKEHCVKKEDLPDEEEIFKIVFDNINEKDIRLVAQAIAKRIRGEKG